MIAPVLRRFAGAVVWVSLCSSATGTALAQRLGPEFQVNSFTTGRQWLPAVAGNGLGNFVVVWSSLGQDGSGYGVFGQRFDSTGAPLGSEFQVNSVTTDDQRWPAVAADDTGDFVVVWVRSGQGYTSYDIFGRRFDALANPQGTEFQVNTYTTSVQHLPAVARVGSGEFIVVWESLLQDGSSLGIFGQRFSSAGSPAGSEFQVNSYTTDAQTNPSIAAGVGGGFVVVWSSHDEDAPGSGIFGQVFDSAGAPDGGAFQVNTYTFSFQGDPRIARDAAGDFVVVWASHSQDGWGYGIFGQRLSSSGTPAGSEFPVNRFSTYDQAMPAVSADASGDVVITWADLGQNGGYEGISAQRYDVSGAAVGGQFRVDGAATETVSLPAIAASGAGESVVVWMTGGVGAAEEIFGQRLQPPVFADGFEGESVCGWSEAAGSGDICP